MSETPETNTILSSLNAVQRKIDESPDLTYLYQVHEKLKMLLETTSQRLHLLDTLQLYGDEVTSSEN
jgi:hypothetical protein